MKIALVIERMDPIRGGRETYTAEIAANLALRGHDITIICQMSSWQCDSAEINTIELGRIGRGRLQKLQNFVAGVQGEIASGEYDIVHAMLPIPGANVYHPHGGTIEGSMDGALRRRGKLLRPISRAMKNLNRCRAESMRLEQQIVQDNSALCVCVSQLIADQFEQYYNKTSNVRVVFNGVHTPDIDGAKRTEDRQRVRKGLGIGDDDPVFLTVATNFPLKGVRESIVAFAKWYYSKGRKKGVSPRLVVVGRQHADGYKRIAAGYDVGRLVVFAPPTDDIFQWYAAADAFVLLTWYDPCSLTVLEAARWGVPSMTTRFNGAAAAFGDTGCIVVDSPNNKKAAADGFAALANVDTRRTHAVACEALSEKLSIDRHVDELLEAYREAPELK